MGKQMRITKRHLRRIIREERARLYGSRRRRPRSMSIYELRDMISEQEVLKKVGATQAYYLADTAALVMSVDQMVEKAISDGSATISKEQAQKWKKKVRAANGEIGWLQMGPLANKDIMAKIKALGDVGDE